MSMAPASPANAPEIAIARIRFFFTLIPPYAAASGLKPDGAHLVAERRPVENAQKTTSAASAMKMPMSRPWSPASPQKTGSSALGAMALETGTVGWVDVLQRPAVAEEPLADPVARSS